MVRVPHTEADDSLFSSAGDLCIIRGLPSIVRARTEDFVGLVGIYKSTPTASNSSYCKMLDSVLECLVTSCTSYLSVNLSSPHLFILHASSGRQAAGPKSLDGRLYG
jgi:hypothetical protein